MGEITAPEPLTGQHDLSGLDCGEVLLNDWLRHNAQRNQANGSSRTYVVCEADKVVGYYSLATGGVTHTEATSRIRRNTPDPIPVLVLGRLAVDGRFQGKGIGSGLLRDALLRALAVSETVDVRAVLVHAISAETKRFYLERGFAESPANHMTLLLPLSAISKALQT